MALAISPGVAVAEAGLFLSVQQAALPSVAPLQRMARLALQGPVEKILLEEEEARAES
jgi:hypothetical protein